MPEMTSYSPGAFCWVELATTDAAGSKNFYSRLLGWSFVDNPAEGGVIYSMAMKDGKSVCGLYQIGPDMPGVPAGVPPHWSSYISVTDVDAQAARVADAGGSVMMPPSDVPNAGRMSIVADATGAVFGLWQPGEHFGAQLMHQSGALGWNELYTTDTEAAAAFYGNLFGWSRTINQTGPYAQDYHEFRNGETPAGGMLQIKPEWGEVPPNWSVYFCVDDCAASLEQAQSMGAEVVVPITEVEHVKFAFLKDPQGIYLGIVQVTSQDG